MSLAERIVRILLKNKKNKRNEVFKIFRFSKKTEEISLAALRECAEQFIKIEGIKEKNSVKVLEAFTACGVSESHFNQTSGYGYNDRGREKLDELFSHIFRAEDALVRADFVSGTHALSTCLFGVLRPGDKILSVSGVPYDTMKDVIEGENCGSLAEFGVKFEYMDLSEDKDAYFGGIRSKLQEGFKAVYIQRSRGYSLRKSLLPSEIGQIADFVKSIDPNIIVIVDNCYGEFVDLKEPLEYGADLIVGSLIKNPGGGVANRGGYIAGKKELIELCSYRLTAPGIGKEIGANPYGLKDIFMGIYNAPMVVAEALKTAVFTSKAFEILGYEVFPKFDEVRADIVQSVVLGSEKDMVFFCKGIQKGSPIDSFVSPEPWDMPGYESKVVMAAGNFISGSSIELSADGPIRSPYAVWLQGGTNFYCAKIGIMQAIEEILKNKK